MRKTFKLLLFIFVCIVALPSFAQRIEGKVTKEQLKVDIETLISDKFAGRCIGTKGDTITACFLRDELAKCPGIKLLNDNGLQPFADHFAFSDNKFFIDGKEVMNVNKYRYSYATGEFSGEMVFVGYGQKCDIDRANLKGKWAIIIDRTPEKYMDMDGEFKAINFKIDYALKKGAIGVLIINKNRLYPNCGSSDNYGRVRNANKAPILGFSGIHFDYVDFEKFDQQNMDNPSYEIIYIKSNFKCNLIDKKRQDISTFNVVGYIKGSDSNYRDEVIVLGAHYDANQNSEYPKRTCYGADDNASGTAMLLQVAKILSQNRKYLKRSVAIVFFGAEERGTLGSMYINAHQPYKGKNVCMINLDMIGRMDPDKTKMYGTSRLIGREKLLGDLSLKGTNLVTDDFLGGFSDHRNYILNEVPGIGIITVKHKDYHKPSDTIDKLNFEGMESIAEYWLEVLNRLLVECYEIGFDKTVTSKI